MKQDATEPVSQAPAELEPIGPSEPAPAPANVITLADGAQVILRDHYPLSQNRDLFALMNHATVDDLATMVPLAQRCIESWPYEGDPAVAASYDHLDAMRIWPILKGVELFLWNRMRGEPKK